MKFFFSKKAQFVLEYALLMATIIAALIGVGAYLKRGIQGRFKMGADAVAGNYQYEAGRTQILGR